MPSKYTIYHNPRCSKSREALSLLQQHSEEIEVVEYLKNPPSEAELKRVIDLLNINPEELVRKGEPLYKEQYKGNNYSKSEWIKILAANPILIERPIVVTSDKAVLGRPAERILDLI